MKHITVLFGFVASAMAAVVPPAPALPLPLGEVGWQGSVTPGGPTIEVWGESFEDIEAQIKKDHPDFSIYTPEESARVESSADPAFVAKRTLETRQRDPNCDPRYGKADFDDIARARENLYNIAGNSCKARARTCIRTQCIYGATELGSAIGICNDNYHDIDIPCNQIADWTNVILQNCHETHWDCLGSIYEQCRITHEYLGTSIFSWQNLEYHCWNMQYDNYPEKHL